MKLTSIILISGVVTLGSFSPSFGKDRVRLFSNQNDAPPLGNLITQARYREDRNKAEFKVEVSGFNRADFSDTLCVTEEDDGETCLVSGFAITVGNFAGSCCVQFRPNEVEFAPGSSCGVLDFRLRGTIKSGVVPKITGGSIPNVSFLLVGISWPIQSPTGIPSAFSGSFNDAEPEVDAADACNGT